MALPGSGAISLSQLQAEFGGSDSISISEYYRSPNGLTTSNNTNVPLSGAISLSQFYGATNAPPYSGSMRKSSGQVTGIFGTGYGYAYGSGGDMSPVTHAGATFTSFMTIGTTLLMTFLSNVRPTGWGNNLSVNLAGVWAGTMVWNGGNGYSATGAFDFQYVSYDFRTLTITPV